MPPLHRNMDADDFKVILASARKIINDVNDGRNPGEGKNCTIKDDLAHDIKMEAAVIVHFAQMALGDTPDENSDDEPDAAQEHSQGGMGDQA